MANIFKNLFTRGDKTAPEKRPQAKVRRCSGRWCRWREARDFQLEHTWRNVSLFKPRPLLSFVNAARSVCGGRERPSLVCTACYSTHREAGGD